MRSEFSTLNGAKRNVPGSMAAGRLMRRRCYNNRAAEEQGRTRTPVPTLVDATTLLVGAFVDGLSNGNGLMLALASGLSGGGFARPLDVRRARGGTGCGFGGVGGILARRDVSDAVPIYIAHGHARRCFRAGVGGDGFYRILLVPVVVSCFLARGLTRGNIAGCKVPVDDPAVFGLLVRAATAGLAGGEVTRALSLRGGRLRFLLMFSPVGAGSQRAVTRWARKS